MDQLLGMVPYLSQNLGLPEYIFQGIRENAEKFDFDPKIKTAWRLQKLGGLP